MENTLDWRHTFFAVFSLQTLVAFREIIFNIILTKSDMNEESETNINEISHNMF